MYFNNDNASEPIANWLAAYAIAKIVVCCQSDKELTGELFVAHYHRLDAVSH
jgi:hypothetical protein